jgi:ABC-type transport system involved in cytochrome c biogenesis ATPase subunit
MQFSKLVIQNFRSVGPKPLTIPFSEEDNMAVIVGVNGAGKSNILHALSIVLSVYPDSRFDPDEHDFHCGDTTRELIIELHLRTPLIEHDVYQSEYKICGFRMRCWRLIRGDGKGVLKKEHYCFGNDGKTLVKPERISKKVKDGEKLDSGFRPLLATDYTWRVGQFFYLDAPTLEKFFDRTTGWSPLGRLFDIYRDDFDAEKNQFEIKPGERVAARDAFTRFSRRLGEIMRTQKLKDIETQLSTHTADYLGLESPDALKIEFALPTHQQLFDKAVELHIADCAGVPSLPAEYLGSGTRALIRLAVIESLLALSESDRRLVFLIEEPEIYLQVHLRRYFRRVLRKLSDEGHQIICTSHSPEFVDLNFPAEVIRCVRTPTGDTQVHQVPPHSSYDFGTVTAKLRTTGNEELFFARHVFLTEGRDDQAIVEFLLRASGVDPDTHVVSVVQCGSANNLPDYIRLCGALGIDCYVLHDEDDATGNASRNKRIASAVTALHPPTASLHLYRPRLEHVLGESEKCGLDALVAKIEGKSYSEISIAYPALVVPINEFITTRSLKKEATTL